MFALVFLAVLGPSWAFQCTREGYQTDPDDCSKFYICVAGFAYNMACPDGLMYNEGRSYCDWPENVNCGAQPAPQPTESPDDVTESPDDVTESPDDVTESPDDVTESPDDVTETPIDVTESQPEERADPAGGFKVVCYFPNWSIYRKEGGKYTPKQVDPNLCTHLVYAFAVLDQNNKVMKEFDSWADIDLGQYKDALALKKQNPNLKVMIAIGGWSDSAGNKYSQLVSNAQARANFNEQAVQFMKKYGFDGLDLDWEYPGCPQGGCGASPADKQNFGIWVKELRARFNKESPKLLLSAAVSASKNVIDNAYDVPAMASALDHINVMAYDYHGSWEATTGQNAPFKAGPGMDPVLTVEYSMKYWQQKGAPASKLVMGLPAYGKSWTLANPSSNGFGAAGRGAGKAGEFTGEGGLLAYYEVCKNIKNGWKKGSDANAGPYAYSGDQWVGYDDPATIAQKTQFAKSGGYGGAMVWDIAMDDFTGNCCGVKNPLLNVINNVLFGKGTAASAMKCG